MMLRRVHAHPFLLGAAPVLLLWAGNAAEVTATMVLPVLVRVLVGVVAVLVVSLLVVRDLGRAALVTSVAALLVLSHGYLLGDLLPGLLGLAAGGVVLAVAAVGIVRAEDEVVGTAALLANVAGAVLVVAAVPGVTSAVAADAGDIPTSDVAELLAQVEQQPTRDIFYIIPDRYGRADTLSETYDIDNTAFIDSLEQQGFEVVDHAVANYPRTAHSLGATLNMTYLEDLAASVPDGTRDSWRPVYDMFDDHLVGKVLTAVGYEYVHVGTWWSPTATAASADQVRNYESGSEFANVFSETTAIPAILDLFGGSEPATHRERTRAHSAWQLDELDLLVAEAADTTDAPRFVLMHITLPHEPYVFDTDGTVVTKAEEDGRTTAENFERQLRYLNSRLGDALAQLSSLPEETAPIVLLQADEGPHPERMVAVGGDAYAWGSASDAELRTKFGVLSAFRLPGVDAGSLVREDMTPVNSFRLILDTYLGTELGQLEDRALVYPDPDDLYTFTDVTDRLRGEAP